MKLETLLARITDNNNNIDPYAASHIPVYQTATFDLKKQSGDKIYDYTRTDNPTRNALEDIFTLAENGSGAVCTNTGLSAVALLFETVLSSGDSILVERDCYGGTYRLLKILSEKFAIKTIYTDMTDLSETENILNGHDIKLVICESPTNPGLKIIDIAACARLCKKYNVLFAVDNSLATFASQKPLELGADFSVFSATKYISGHGSVVSGALVAKDIQWRDKMRYYANAEGRTQSPFDAFLISLGLPTLTYRMKAQEQSALKIALYLSDHKDVITVSFPLLQNHKQYELAKTQMSVCPGLLTVNMISLEKADRFVSKTKLFGEKASFGTADSRIEQPAKISHQSFSEEDLKAIGISKSTIRLSIGLENTDDILNDIESALN
ncbi:MAG: aminotransferase class I/II-fold pyridoxal phosphate-dependent enzyme [Ignavibacteria bacterium]